MPVGPFFICWLLIEVHGVEECLDQFGWHGYVACSLYVRCYSIFAIFDCLLKNLEGDLFHLASPLPLGRPILQQTSRACVSLCPDDTSLFLSKHHMEAAVTFGAETPAMGHISPKQAHPQMIHGCIWVPILKCSSVVLL
jgi:hypothetical protein